MMRNTLKHLVSVEKSVRGERVGGWEWVYRLVEETTAEVCR